MCLHAYECLQTYTSIHTYTHNIRIHTFAITRFRYSFVSHTCKCTIIGQRANSDYHNLDTTCKSTSHIHCSHLLSYIITKLYREYDMYKSMYYSTANTWYRVFLYSHCKQQLWDQGKMQWEHCQVYNTM